MTKEVWLDAFPATTNGSYRCHLELNVDGKATVIITDSQLLIKALNQQYSLQQQTDRETEIRPFNGLFSRTTSLNCHQKG